MEMDIPLPEELEWLETNALFPDDDEYTVEEEDEDLQELSRPKITDPPASPGNQTCRKRPWSEENEESGAPGKLVTDEEREIKRRSLETESDEDWLRYSPSKDAVADLVPEADDPLPVVAEEMVISRFASEIEGDCISVTGHCGDRVYAKMSSLEKDGDWRKLIREKPAHGLLLEPINDLMKRVEQEALTKALEASFETPSDQTHSTTPIVSEQLWVDKYAPNSFTELLSDEQTNREVLLWLKQWDSCVFGSHIRVTTDDVLSSLRRHSSLVQHQKYSDNKSFFNKNKGSSYQNFKASNVSYKDDENVKSISESWSKKPSVNNPLEQKVLLLCGSPGLGKTTLAHVAAKHCGYRVVEINASDDRSSSTIESKILDVVQMNSVMADSKPKCLVIDEIDGALGEGKGAVEVILKMLAADKKSTVEKGHAALEAQPGKASSRKGHKTAALSRPVICICNDLYAPALRPLRQVAKVHTFVQPTVSRVVNRLTYICKREGFKASSIALSALADYTECDIRSCLNTLQFLNKKKQTLNILEISSQVVGRKDISRSVFDVWKGVLQKRNMKRERKSMSSCSGHGDFDFLYSLVSNRGDYDLTMDGIHENFLQLRYHDPMMLKTVKCLDVLGVSDSLHQYIMRTQQMPLLVYQPPIAITLSYLIAQVDKPKIEWPKSLMRCRAMRMERKDILKTWHNKISPSISRHLSAESFVEDIVSPFLHILSPPTLRPVALHLLSEREKDDLAQLVDTMVSYSITYKNSKPEFLPKIQKYGSASDAPVLSFDPPVDDFVNFKDYQSGHSGLSLPMKQVLVHEVEKQRIMGESFGRSLYLNDRRNVENQITAVGNAKASPAKNFSTIVSVENNTGKPKVALIQRQMIANAAPNSASEVNKSAPASSTNAKASGDSKRPSSQSSFFDRFRKGSGTNFKKTEEALQKAATRERDSRPLLFKYNEGFTNAVKRPVKIRELLQ